MTENSLLEGALYMALTSGYEIGYDWLLEKREELPEGDYPQVYYYLCCLAAGAGETEQAVEWLREAVEGKGYWYRKDALEDIDLLPLFQNEEFLRLKALSLDRCEAAMAQGESICSFREKTREDILLCLHGNGQNAAMARAGWGQLADESRQVETLQAATAESWGRWRWHYDDEDYRQLTDCLQELPWGSFRHRTLAGFSAGCDVILRAVALGGADCELLLLQSPITPFIKSHGALFAGVCADKGIAVRVFCGDQDRKGFPHAVYIYEALKDAGVDVTLQLQNGLRHEFPEALGKEYR